MLFNIAFPFILAIFISYLIYPTVKWFEKYGLKRSIGIIFVYILTLSITFVMLILVYPHVDRNMRELVNTLPQIISTYKVKLDYILDMIVKSGFPQDIKTSILNEIYSSLKKLESFSLNYIKEMLIDSISILPIIVGTFVAFILTYYYLRDIEVFKNFALSLIPTKYRNDLIIIGRDSNKILKRFVHGQVLIAFIIGILEILGLYILGVKFPFFLGFIGGLANIIPYFGPIIASIPAILIALSDSFTKGVLTLLLFIIIQQIDNAFITPRIIEGKLGLHPVFTIFVVILGGELLGVLGMLFAVPVTAIIKIIVKRIIEKIA